MRSEFGKPRTDGADRRPDPDEPLKLQELEKNQERRRWMKPGVHLIRGPLGFIRGIAGYIGSTVAIPFQWRKRRAEKRLARAQLRHEQRRLRAGIRRRGK